METENQFEELSKFTGRDVELFRSSDKNNTALYFTDMGDNYDQQYRDNAKAFFEILRFGLKGGDHQIYIRFPNSDHFVEMVGGGFGSAWGNMMESNGENVHAKKHDMKFKIYSHGKNLIYLIGDSIPKFNFMTKVAEYNNGNPYTNPPIKTKLNIEEIEAALEKKYLKLPDCIRRIEYLFKTNGESPTYFVVDYPAYNFGYDKQRFRTVTNGNITEYKVKSFGRWRDGGTTQIIVTDEAGNEHKFFAPQRMFPVDEMPPSKFDDMELIEEVTEEERKMIVDLLSLDLVPEMEKEKEEMPTFGLDEH